MTRFNPIVEQKLRESGWHPERIVPDAQLAKWLVIECPRMHSGHTQIRMFSIAYRVLREFGGLRVEQDEPGISLYRNPFVFDPLGICDSMASEYWFSTEWMAGGSLFPLGYFDVGHKEPFAINTQGHILNPDDYSGFYGATIEIALENFILGNAPQPLVVDESKIIEANSLLPFIDQQMSHTR